MYSKFSDEGGGVGWGVHISVLLPSESATDTSDILKVLFRIYYLNVIRFTQCYDFYSG
jgi:hypothetical protein